MSNSDRRLQWLLRVLGVTTLLALPAVFMPASWMAGIHQWLGLGELPTAPIVQNLARSVSFFYAMFGAICLVLAGDLERYRSLVRILGVLLVLFGVVLIGIDLAAPMPAWWTASEGLSTIAFGVLLLALGRGEP